MTYRDEAVRHCWELVHDGLDRQPALLSLFQAANARPGIVLDWLRREVAVYSAEFVRAVPSRRPAMLNRFAKEDAVAQVAIVLGAWQHCRKAVLAYGQMIEEGIDRASGPYRRASAHFGSPYDRIVDGHLTKWPRQWGASPFVGDERSADFIAMIDTYDPATGHFDI